MLDHQKILQFAEEVSKTVQDPELRKIAFQEIVRNELQKTDANKGSAKGQPASSVPEPKVNRVKAQAKGKQARGAREIVQQLDISPDEKELPAWSSMSQDWKKFCWILESARLKGVDGLTAPEISFLIDKIFREDYPSALVANLKKKIKGAIVRIISVDVGDRNVPAWKILRGGTEALSSAAEVSETK